MIKAENSTVMVSGDVEELYADLACIVGVMKMHIPTGMIAEAIEIGLQCKVDKGKRHSKDVMDMLKYILERRDAQANKSNSDKQKDKG